MIPQDIIEEVQAASDIVDVVSSCVPLKRAGRNFKALCPFHNEKTPSFFVSPEKQIWHCFGCGAGGSVFNFIVQYERVSFPEAVRHLAARAGIKVPEGRGERRGGGLGKEEFYRLNEFACSWFHRQLTATRAGAEVRSYLHGRGVGDDVIGEFSLGYAPEAWDALLTAARKRGFREEMLLALGLVMKKEGGARVFDRFRNRLMVPIADVGGRIIAFSGRAMGDASPKYMNSPESLLFNKSRSLFGLHLSRRAIIDEGFAVVVEGYFDLFALYRAGIRNVVASQGTAFTAEHARIMKRYAGELIMSFDADQAGQTAAVRTLEAIAGAGLRVRVLALPLGHDPDTFVREKGTAAFRRLVGSAPHYFDHLMDLLCAKYDAAGEVGKAQVASDFLDALSRVPDAVLREAYLKKLSARIGVSEQALIDELRRKRRRAAPSRPAGTQAREGERLPAGEREIIRLMIEDEGVVRLAAESLDPNEFRDEHLRRIARMAFEMFRKGEWEGSARLLSRLRDEQCARLLSGIISEDDMAGDRENLARDCIRYIRRRNLKEDVRRLAEEVGRRERAGSPEGDILELQKMLMEKKAKLLEIG